ncbi:hypothetical protein Ancab_036109 [Ancistrocladus abbreviatus]
MTAESRGQILGERPLERSPKDSSSSVASADVHVYSKLSDTFTKPESFAVQLATAMPFKDDPAKQQRFKKLLKDKYKGGLHSTESGGAGNMSEAARAHERLDFEAATEAIDKAKFTNPMGISAQRLMELKMTAGLQFTAGGAEPPPAPRMRSKMDSFLFGSEFVTTGKAEEIVSTSETLVCASIQCSRDANRGN